MYDNDEMKKMAEVFEGMLRKGKLQELTSMLEGIAPVAETRALQEMYHGKAENDPKLIKKGREEREKGMKPDYQFGPGDDHPHEGNPWKFPEHKPKSLKGQKVAPKQAKSESVYYAWQTLGLGEGNDWERMHRDAEKAGDLAGQSYSMDKMMMRKSGKSAAKHLATAKRLLATSTGPERLKAKSNIRRHKGYARTDIKLGKMDKSIMRAAAHLLRPKK